MMFFLDLNVEETPLTGMRQPRDLKMGDQTQYHDW